MNHWYRILPDVALEVDYEDLANVPKNIGRQIMNNVGVDWDPRSLLFHERRSNVTTASKWQVRKLNYTKYIGRWRHFQDHLQSMIDVME